VSHGNKLNSGCEWEGLILEDDVGEVIDCWKRDGTVIIMEVGWAAKTESAPFVLNVESPPDADSAVGV
jgi:hypothetical protein